MFEQAVLTNGPGGKRVWTTFLGMTSQVALVSFAVLVPMVWPQVLPLAKFEISLAPPQPPAPKNLGDRIEKQPAQARVIKNALWPLAKYQPTSVPTRIPATSEEMPTPFTLPGATGTERVGMPDGGVGNLWRDLTQLSARAVPVIEKPAPKPPTDATPALPTRHVVGGLVKLGKILHKAEPAYPATAKAAHVSGQVVLECVVGVDGRIHEVTVKSGNALLIKAAVDAAWQWAYEPSQLNGVPIEIVTNLNFNFKLN